MIRQGLVVVVMGTIAWGCGAVESPPPPDPCAQVSCGEGTCALVGGAPACLCNQGFTAVGLSCAAIPPTDLCASNPCANLSNSLCQVNSGRVSCVCPASRVEVNGSCVLRTACVPNPCTTARRTTCEITGGVAFCRCDRGFAPEGDGCSAAPLWTCSAQHNDGDSAEPDECPTLAKPLIIEVEENRSLSPAGDHDWFEIGVTQNHLFSFTATSSGVPLLIEVFEQDGVTLIASDNRGTAFAEITFNAPASQSLMVRVRGVRASDVGTYVVQYRELGVDDYANSPLDAITLLPGPNPFSGNVQYAGDLDVVWLEMPAQTAVRLASADGGSPTDLVIEVARPDGGARILNMGEATTITSAEPLTLTARGRNPRTVGAFALSFEQLGVDDHSDEAAFGTPLASDNVSVPGRFERIQDMDCFRVAQLTDRLYRARWQGPSSYPQASVVLASGQVLTAGYGSGTGIVWKADQSRPAAVRLQSGYSGGVSTYTVAVEDLGLDDHSNTLNAATPMTHGQPVGGRLELSDDVDTFSFTGSVGRILQVTAVNTTPMSNVALSLRVTDPSGIVVSEAPGTVGLLVTSTGTHKVQVLRGGYSSVTDLVHYVVTVTDQGTDDHPSSPGAASTLTLGTPAAGSVQYAADIDAFAFTAVANHVYEVRCTRSTASCPFNVRDPGGQLVLNSGSGYGVFSFLATLAGRWSVEVTAGSSYSPALGPYSLTVNDLGLEDHGANSASATALTIGTPVTGSIGFSQDVDVFSLGVQAGHIYAATVTANSSVRVEVRDASNLLVSSSYGTVSFVAANAGPYYLFLSNYSVSSYSLVVADRGLDDHPNTSAGATSLTMGTASSGVIQYQSDLDFFTVPVLAGHHHLAACDASGCSITVTTPSGTALATGYSSQGAAFKPPAGVTSVFVRVSGSDGLRYALTVSDLGADDHGDARPDATALVLEAAATAGVLETTADVDAFLVTAGVGEVITLNCVSTAGLACGLAVLSPQGSQVLQSSAVASLRTGFLASAAGAYLVLVRGNGYSSGAASYTLAAARGSDDFTTTTPFTRGTPRTGSLDYVTDTDVFSLALTQGVMVTMSVSNGARATVTSPTGGYVTSFYGGYTNSMVPTQTGTYLFTVASDSYGGGLSNYTLSVQ